MQPQYTLISAEDSDGVTIEITPNAGDFVNVKEVHFSYSDTPTDATLVIVQRTEDNGDDDVVLYQVNVTSGGPGPLPMSYGVASQLPGRVVQVRLLDVGVSACLNVWYGTFH